MDPDAFAPFGALRASFADAESADSNPWDASFRIPEKYLGMSRAVNGIASPPARVPERELATILAAAHANLHGVVDAEGRHLGSGVYVRASMFNHSCAPEAVVSFNPGGVLRVHAVEDISVDAPIRIAYSELYATRGSRRDALRAKKGFECACERCVDVDGKWTRRDAALDGWACADADVRRIRSSARRFEPHRCDVRRVRDDALESPVADPDEGAGPTPRTPRA